MKNLFAALAALLVAGAIYAQSPSPAPATPANVREITLVNIKYEGTNVWAPGPIVCKKGDTVKLRLINNVKDEPAEHGLSIEEFKVQAVVKRGEPLNVEFVADQSGIFKVKCHLHLPHVGTQIVVLD